MKRGLLVVLLMGFFGLCGLGVLTLGWMWYQDDRPPVQPIAFSHERHVSQVKLPCEHCHQNARKGPQATVPPMSVCAACHAQMKTGNPEVLKLQSYLKEGRPVEWTKVHRLPWHVLFTHKRHLAAGVACQTCHGQVAVMPRMRKLRSLQMGWCVGCHRDKGASRDCWTCHK